MKPKHLQRLFLVFMLCVLVLPGAAFAQGEDTGTIQRPAPAVPVQIGADFQVKLDPAAAQAAAETAALAAEVAASGDTPVGAVPPEGGAQARYTLPAKRSHMGPDASEPSAAEPDGPDACTNLLQNAGFEANSSWVLSPATNVKYSLYSNGAGRAVYMTTKNRQTAWLGQTLTVPQGTGSIHLSFDVYQNMDPNEGAWVSIWDSGNTQRWWPGQIRGPRGAWDRAYFQLPQASFGGKSVTVWFEMWPNNDNVPSDMWLDNVKFELCTAAPTPTVRTGGIDLKISMYKNVSAAERKSYEEIFGYAANGIYEMTNGAHYLKSVTVYQGRGNSHRADAHVWWYECVWPQAHLGGFWRLGNERLYFGDWWPGGKFIPGPPQGCPAPQESMLQETQVAGYTLAHELGHFYYGLADEYPNPDYPGDRAVDYSMMSYSRCAADTENCYDSRYWLAWLNFSTRKNFVGPNNQARFFLGKSGWEVLTQAIALDGPDARFLGGRPKRTLYPDLAPVAPKPWEWPEQDLLTSRPPQFAMNWLVSTSNVTKEDLGYTANVRSDAEAGETTITYPEPLLLVAQLGKDFPIARSVVSTQVTAPNGAVSALTLRDDGVAPDYLADDGKFTGILPYDQNGAYKIGVTFTNAANRAAYTSVGLEDVPWGVGEPIGENFSVSAGTTVITSGYTGDDHADRFSEASELFSDNEPKRGQIDRAGDRDMFKSTLIGDGTFVLRLSSFALDMQPRLRLWRSDGTTLIGEWTLVPEEGYYYFIRLTGPMGASFYTEISHMDGQAMQGMYALSFGYPLPNEETAEPHMLFLPIITR